MFDYDITNADILTLSRGLQSNLISIFESKVCYYNRLTQFDKSYQILDKFIANLYLAHNLINCIENPIIGFSFTSQNILLQEMLIPFTNRISFGDYLKQITIKVNQRVNSMQFTKSMAIRTIFIDSNIEQNLIECYYKIIQNQYLLNMFYNVCYGLKKERNSTI